MTNAVTQMIPVTPVIRKLPPIEVPLTQRVAPVDAPTLTLYRDNASWRSEDGGYNYPSTAHMLADWVNGVVEIPDPTPLEAATAYFATGSSLPFEVSEVTQGMWDAARVIVEEVRSDVFTPTQY